jgi:hypothetical protein
MQGNMIRLGAFDFVLRLVRCGVMSMPLVVQVLRMDLDNPATDMSGLGIPNHVIADFESFGHLMLPTRDGAERFNLASGSPVPPYPGRPSMVQGPRA